jgi:hypothetical protein
MTDMKISDENWEEQKKRYEAWKASLPTDIRDAHAHSRCHRSEISKSNLCGCFYCLETFPPSEIESWIDKNEGDGTAICPRCGIDSVIGSASSFPVTQEFLAQMKSHWF